EYVKQKDLSMAANGTLYTKEFKGFMSDLMETMYEERRQYKAQMIEVKKEKNSKTNLSKSQEQEYDARIAQLDTMQNAKKTALNRCNGGVGDRRIKFFEKEPGESNNMVGLVCNSLVGTKVKWFFTIKTRP